MFKEYYYLLQELKQPNHKYQIYVDMDGVLTNFEFQVKSKTGKTAKELEIHGDEHFWSEIKKAGIEFWSKMPKMHGIERLWNFLKPFNPKILSAPARSIEFCVKGKREWINSNLGTNVEALFVRASNKRDYANSNSILIDDLEKNVKAWKEAGGIGILHKSPEETLKQLQNILKLA